jgi:hypothetical protein
VEGPKSGWWKELERVEVSLIPEKEGWFLTKYRLESDVSLAAIRENGVWIVWTKALTRGDRPETTWRSCQSTVL